MADIVLINPRFEVSYWGMEYALPLLGKRANLPVACLPLVAALTSAEHTVTIMDENVEPIDWERCERADIVGMTGMSVQRFRMKEMLTELKSRGCFCVVGGPWITVQEDYFGELADVIFIGEAEDTWPQFLTEWKHGLHQYRYEQLEKTDMTKVPTPRFDLLKMKHYGFGSLQFSRGCPFQCEFCDIIVTFGRRPRIKTSKQVLAELDAIYATGIDLIFIVDDNLIGNKKAIKEVLRDVIAWQERHNYDLTFFTEASIDLADDPELMDLMVQANFIATFIGIESPDEDALREAKKYQNVRKGGTLLEKVHRIQEAGMEVWCGMIMGFDSDDEGIFDRQVDFIQHARIPFSMSRNALGDSQDAATRPACRRRPARPVRCVRIRDKRRPASDEPRRSARRLSPGAERALRSRRLLRAHRSLVPESLVRDRHQEEKKMVRSALHRQGNRIHFQGHRAFPSPDDSRRRASPSPRLPAPALALLEGSPAPRVRALLPVPHDNALSRPVSRPKHGQPRAATRQFVLVGQALA